MKDKPEGGRWLVKAKWGDAGLAESISAHGPVHRKAGLQQTAL